MYLSIGSDIVEGFAADQRALVLSAREVVFAPFAIGVVSLMSEIWERARKRVEQRVGAQNYEIWIRPIRWVSQVGAVVELEVPNRYYLDWVQDNYEGALTDALTEVIGMHVRLRFSVEQAVEPEEPPLDDHGAHGGNGGGDDIGGLGEEDLSRRFNLPADKTFETYIVGSCNQFAHAAALAVADFPGQNYNPLFIFGSTGLGKTHLVQGIGNRILQQNAASRIVYTTAEDFVNEMIRALRFKRMEEFRARYRQQAHCLIIDDIQFLSGKDRSQAEFFHTFESLKNSGRQIILTADVLPREIDKLEPRLRTRFEGGLLADIQAPDVETMTAILHKKADALNMEVPPELAAWISSRLRGNIRELEGALNRLAALHRFYNERLTIEFARRHLGGMLAEEAQAITPEKILREVARYYNVKVNDLVGDRKLKGIVVPRQVAMYLARKHTNLSFPDLGRAFGGRDHSTIQHACKKIKEMEPTDADLRSHLGALESSLGV